MTDQQRRHERFMRMAIDLATAAAEHGDVPVGCVIVRGDEVVGRGANAIERTGEPTRHAEIEAIEMACRTVGEKFLDDCTLYVTLEPCSMCAGAIVLSRLPTVVYGAADPKTGACRSVFELADDPRLNHRAIIRTGVLADECAALLSKFFATRRQEHAPAVPAEAPAPAASALVPTLLLVPVPIGNLDDVTKRALKALRDADVIVCEDTRATGSLLRHYNIVPKRLVSNHEHNERERAAEIVRWLREGRDVVLVSDAGMPGISDPGYRAVRACLDAGLNVSALPGASAVITAVAASGLPTDAFAFAGFPPQKKGRRAWLEAALMRPETTVIYESPHRLASLLEEIRAVAGADRQVVVARELSKLHEEYIRGTAGEVHEQLANRPSIKGECVVLVGGAAEA
ncbi:MAG: 16S rRNA (cytidine(1402)-2'-O)-methyltransferase [Candidatus Kapabacteria bacterium]|nr:16S rRNA (cytidine(1402)-2'-O)-methyltransferase [Candidatus Kapabacteria bacterium]